MKYSPGDVIIVTEDVPKGWVTIPTGSVGMIIERLGNVYLIDSTGF